MGKSKATRTLAVSAVLAAIAALAWTLVVDRTASIGGVSLPWWGLGIGLALGYLATLANHAGVATESGRLIVQLNREILEREHQALHDSLTGLPNRSMFFERMTTAMAAAAGSSFAVMLMDLDGFKALNDTLGHHSGDLMLQEIAARLPGALPEGATVARLGGDEFALLLPSTTDGAGAVETALVIKAVLATPFEIDGATLEACASIGIAMWPQHAEGASDLLKCADVAMYAAKASAGGIETFQPERDGRSRERRAIAAQLRRSLDDLAVDVHYQPVVRLTDGATVGAEALVRWQHPERGNVRPCDFLGVAERAGLIRPLTAVVLHDALEQCGEWRRGGHDLTVSVNLSGRVLLDLDLPGDIERIIGSTGGEPDWLTLEVSESEIMDPRRGLSVLERLADIGVHLSIDDFGTGYSSLAYLQQLPVSELKVDRSFIAAMDGDSQNAVLVRTVIDLAHNLDLHVVAEGVETARGWGALCAMGCDGAQGYLFSRALPADAFGRWLRNRTATAAVPLLAS